jgi:hypothetical protein
MADGNPTLDQWRGLFATAIQVKELAPWTWMEETDIFGVQNPATGEPGFVSVMGMAGEHFAVALYPDARALYDFWAMHEEDMDLPRFPPEFLLEVSELQLSFEDRNELRTDDRDLIKQLGLKFRGAQAWPIFRSYGGGLAPWFLSAEEARFLHVALAQLLDVAPRFRENPDLLYPGEDDRYLVRVSRQEGDSLVWEDRIVLVPPVEPEPVQIKMDMQALEALKRLPKGKAVIEADFFIMPVQLGERGRRPHFAYMLLLVERDSGYVLGSDLFEPLPSLEAMWGEVPMKVAQYLARVGLRPRVLHARYPLLLNLVTPLAKELGFVLDQKMVMPSLDEAKEFLIQRFT